MVKLAESLNLKVWVAVAAVLLAAGGLRFYAVYHTAVWGPYRADAAQYFNYAYNMRHYGVYSRESDSVVGKVTHPKPDAMRTPGYSLFLVPFADSAPTWKLFRKIQLWQAGLGVLVVLGIFLIFRRFIPPSLAIAAAALVALSPQQVNIANYILSENLFTPLLVAVILALGWSLRGGRWFLWGMFATGLCIGMAALTRPVLEYFLPCIIGLLFFTYARKVALRGAAVLVLGFALLWAPWLMHNYATLDKAGSDRLMIETVHQGMYPDMMYQGDPKSRGYPYRFDPNYKKTDATLDSVLAEVGRQWEQQPGTELAWYLLGKPVQLWSWSMVAGAGDIFIYPTPFSPYKNQVVFMSTHIIMRGLHWTLVVFALIGCILVFLPIAKRLFDDSSLFLLRSVSMLLLYNTAILMVGAPFTRYSTPFLPFAFGMAMVAVYALFPTIRRLQVESRERHLARRQ